MRRCVTGDDAYFSKNGKHQRKELKKGTREPIGFMVILLQSETVKLADGAGNFAFRISHMKIVSIAQEKNGILEAETEPNTATYNNLKRYFFFFQLIVDTMLLLHSKQNLYKCVQSNERMIYK